MRKSEVYNWRVSPDIKSALEMEARREGVTLASLLHRIAEEWLRVRRASGAPEQAEQLRLHAAAGKTFGTIAGGKPRRAERARSVIQERMARRHAR